jgi:hypothetical protein
MKHDFIVRKNNWSSCLTDSMNRPWKDETTLLVQWNVDLERKLDTKSVNGLKYSRTIFIDVDISFYIIDNTLLDKYCYSPVGRVNSPSA